MPATAPVRERRETLLGDPRVKRWYKDHRTPSTAEVQLTQLELFLRRTRVTVDVLLDLARAQRGRRSKKFEDLVHAWVESEREGGRPDSYLATNWYAVRSFLRHEESAPEWAPKLKVRFGTTIANEVVPTPEQLRAVLDRTPVPRIRSLILMLGTSGMRIGVLGARFSINGLRLRDLPDLEIERLKFRRVPFRINVPAELSKGGSAYFTFATEETANEYVGYLRVRRERGEKLGPASAVFAPEPKASNVHLRVAGDGTAFISEKGLADEIRRAFAKVSPAGVRWRPYVLRSFTSSQLMLAENAGLITRDAREFLLAHTADVGRRYNLSKGRVRSDLEQEVHEMYSRSAQRFLRILTLSEPESLRQEFRTLLLVKEGLPIAEAEQWARLPAEEILKRLSDRHARNSSPAGAATSAAPNGRVPGAQRIVSVEEAEALLPQGWEVFASAGEKLVVRLAN